MHRSNHRVLCTIAGFDPTGSAGWGVDLAVFEALGCRGRAVVTAETEQGSAGVLAVEPKKPASVASELTRVLAEDAPAALKTGMLATAGIVDAVAATLAAAAARPLVVDPVLAAGAGGALLEDAAIPALAARLGPHATLLTPNRPEAARLLGLEAIEDAEDAAQALRAAGWDAVLLKDGHGAGPEVVDVLATASGTLRYRRPRLPGGNVRGTGCALAAAIAGWLARGTPLPEAVERAGDWLHRLIAEAHASARPTLDVRAVRLPPWQPPS